MAEGPKTLNFLQTDWEEFVENLYTNTSNGTDAAELAAEFRKTKEQDGHCLHPRTRELSTITAGTKVFCVSCNEQIR